MPFPKAKVGNFTFQGASIAGVFTSLASKELSLAFDVANGPQFLFPIKNYFITHGHADHAAGLPYLLSMKALSKQPPVQVYMPGDLLPPMQKILELWQDIEEHSYNYQLHPVSLSETYDLKGSYFVRPFQTFHRVSSFGYTVFESKKSLREEFRSQNKETILKAKSEGIEIHDYIEVPLISFTGDTRIEFWDSCSWVKQSKTLFVEVSFIDKQRTIEETRHWGHIHLDEILPLIEEFQGEQLILIHLSQRYSTHQLEILLKQKLKPELLKKVKVWPRQQ